MEAEVWKTIGKKGGADGWEEWEPSKKLPIQRGGWSKFFSQQSTNCHASNTQAGRVIIFHIFFLVERQQKNGVSPIFFDGWSSPTEFEQKKTVCVFLFLPRRSRQQFTWCKKGAATWCFSTDFVFSPMESFRVIGSTFEIRSRRFWDEAVNKKEHLCGSTTDMRIHRKTKNLVFL